MSNDSNVLDLSVLSPDRKQVVFVRDGTTYEMILPSELTLEQRAILFAIQRKMARLNEQSIERGDLSESQMKQLTELNNKAARMILIDMPDGDFIDLSDFHKEAVVLDFLISYGKIIRQTAMVVGGEEIAKGLSILSER